MTTETQPLRLRTLPQTLTDVELEQLLKLTEAQSISTAFRDLLLQIFDQEVQRRESDGAIEPGSIELAFEQWSNAQVGELLADAVALLRSLTVHADDLPTLTKLAGELAAAVAVVARERLGN